MLKIDAAQMRPVKLGKQAADHLKSEILRGNLKPGQNLPGEDELMKLFRISRPTLREAIRILEALGLIVVYRGKKGGAEIRLPTIDITAANAAIYLQAKKTTFFELQQARTCIEPTLITLLAGKVRKADLKRLRALLDEAERFIDNTDQYARIITSYHDALFELLGNKVLNLVASVMDLLHQPLVARHLATFPEAARRTHLLENLASQRHMLALMEAGKFAEAGEFCRENLLRLSRTLTRTGGVDKLVDSVAIHF
jgi:DNA-binding FadR family transcriptional regulator